MKFICLCIFLMYSHYSYSQNILQDAITLSASVESGTVVIKKEDLGILAKYLDARDDILSCDDVVEEFDGNPYLSRSDTSLVKLGCNGNTAGNTNKFGGGELYQSSFKPLPQATIIDGIAEFLVKRFKQELSLAFFDKFKKFLLDTEEGEHAKTLFPSTYRTLLSIGDEIYDFDNYLKSLRDAFLLDLRSLPVQTLELLENLDLIKNEELKVLLSSAVIITQGIVDGQLEPLALINDLANSLGTLKDSKFAEYAQLVNFSLNLLMTKGDDIHSFANIQALKNPITLNIFLGLTYQLSEDKTFKTYLKKIKTLSTPIANFASDMHLRINKITVADQTIRTINQSPNQTSGDRKNKILLEEEIMDNIISILERSIPIFDSIVLGGIDSKTEKDIMQGIKILRNVVTIQSNLRLEKYTIAINGIVGLLDNIGAFGDCESEASQIIDYNMRVNLLEKYIPNNATKEKTMVKSIRDSLDKSVGEFNQQQLNQFSKNIESDIKKLKEALIKKDPKLKKRLNQNTRFVFCKWIDKLLKYGSFIAVVAEAKSSEDVTKALEAFALPPGSSRIKKYSTFSISLNSFVGGGFMLEHTLNKQEWLAGALTWHAPIGIAFSTGFGKGGALSLYAAVLDFGAIVSQKITTFSSTPQAIPVSQLDFGHIFAPGLFIYYGLPCDLPVAIGFGGQLGPLLTTVNNSGLTVSEDQKFRFGISLTVDIPITHFYTSSTKPKRRGRRK